MAHEHWDGSSRPRNVNYATRRLGDHEPYFSYGSGGPGDASRGRRGRLEVTLRSYSSVLEYAPERVIDDVDSVGLQAVCVRPSASGEGWDRVYYVPARPRPLGEHGSEPHGLRFTRPLRASRTAAVSQWSMSTGTAAPDRGTSTTLPDGLGTTSPTPATAPVVRGASTGATGDV